MTNRKKAYIAVTALFAVCILPGAVMNLVQPEILVTMADRLGVPLALMSLVGGWKLLGVLALARPQWKRINEWAYAGFAFDLSGAAFLHAAVGDFEGMPATFVLLGLLGASYTLRNFAATPASDLQPATA